MWNYDGSNTQGSPTPVHPKPRELRRLTGDPDAQSGCCPCTSPNRCTTSWLAGAVHSRRYRLAGISDGCPVARGNLSAFRIRLGDQSILIPLLNSLIPLELRNLKSLFDVCAVHDVLQLF